MKRKFLAGIFFVSSATLCLEISLTRYFSISQNYHFAFLIISLAFLGYGASGTFLTLFGRTERIAEDKFLATASLLLSLTILLSFLLSNQVPFDFFQLLWDKKQVGYIFLYYLVLSLPFFFAGMIISFALSRLPAFINKIYCFDLLGAGAGSALAIFVFLPKGEKGVFVLISFLALLACGCFSIGRTAKFKAFLLVLMLAEISLFFWSPAWLSFRISPFKALPLALKYPQAKLLLTRWNSSSRVDVLDSPAARYAPGLSLIYSEKLPPQIGLSLDAGELSAVTSFENESDPDLAFLSYLPSSLAYSLLKHPKALIIEPKAGLDVLAAFAFKASRIKVIENNPLIPELLRRELGEPSGHLYLKDNIQVVSAQSRSALKRDKDRYDLIVFSLTDIFGSSDAGLYGLGENHLFTVDSFTQVLSLLSPEGLISLSLYLLPPPRQELRMLATWIEALEQSHLNPASHIVILRSWGTVSYFIKKTPFRAEDLQKIKSFAEERLFDLIYIPGTPSKNLKTQGGSETPLGDDLFLQLFSPSGRRQIYQSYLFDIRPATDNRPFFFHFYKLNKWKATFEALGRNWIPLLQGGFLIPVLLFLACPTALLFLFVPLLAFRQDKLRLGGNRLSFFGYFGLIGAGFIFVEMVFIQKFMLFLGHPVYSLSVVLVSLLLSSAVGSRFSRRFQDKKLKKNLKMTLCLCSGLIVAELMALPRLFNCLLSVSLPWRALFTLILIFPLGFCLGIPFPTGLRLLEADGKKVIPWAWAANAFSSVVNSITAAMAAFGGGYNLVFILAAACYSLALLFLDFSDHRNKPHS